MSSTRTANDIEKSAFEQWIKLKLDGKQERKPSEKKYQIHSNVKNATIHELIETDLFTG